MKEKTRKEKIKYREKQDEKSFFDSVFIAPHASLLLPLLGSVSLCLCGKVLS
jgi:hypothetical protein